MIFIKYLPNRYQDSYVNETTLVNLALQSYVYMDEKGEDISVMRPETYPIYAVWLKDDGKIEPTKMPSPSASPLPSPTQTPDQTPAPTKASGSVPVTEKFSDVPANKWYAKADGPIQYVIDNGIMNGTGDGSTFEPEKLCTRTMMVKILYNAEGAPAVTGANSFTDVATGKWFDIYG